MIESLGVLDVDEIVKISQGFSESYSKENYLSGLTHGNLKILGFTDNGLKGYIAYSVAIDSADLELLFVEEKWRNRGIAKTLILSAEESLKKEKVKDFFLEVRKSNLIAVKLYQSLGFKIISERKKYYGGEEDALVMKKEI